MTHRIFHKHRTLPTPAADGFGGRSWWPLSEKLSNCTSTVNIGNDSICNSIISSSLCLGLTIDIPYVICQSKQNYGFLHRCLFLSLNFNTEDDINRFIFVEGISLFPLNGVFRFASFEKSNGRLSGKRNNITPLPNLQYFWWMYKMYFSYHFTHKIYTLFTLTRYAPQFKGNGRSIFKSIMNMKVVKP